MGAVCGAEPRAVRRALQPGTRRGECGGRAARDARSETIRGHRPSIEIRERHRRSEGRARRNGSVRSEVEGEEMRFRFRSRSGLLAIAAAILTAASLPAADEPFVIRGARVADGTGGPLQDASVRVEGDTITAVGAIKPRKGERVVDGKGLVLAPGFIDIHNHSTDELLTKPLAETQVSQGITTAVQGADGGSAWPIGEYLDKLRAAPAAINVMTMVGHATVRELVLGKDYRRNATDEEIDKMAELVDRGMREGAAGL